MPLGIHLLDATGGGLTGSGELIAAVHAGFHVAVAHRVQELDLEAAHDVSRGQHDASALVGQVVALAHGADEKLIAIVDVDLFIPVLTFVFGQAQLGGTAAVVSTHRLTNRFYGLPPDRPLLRARIEKEVVHELGHLFGLVHCRQFECVMRSSTYVEEIDLKRATFCDECEGRLMELRRAG